MDTLDAIYQRRAVKHFDPEHTMPDDVLTKLLEATIQSPTSFNIQHWRFVVVKDKALRQKVRELGNDQAQITDASVLIIMTADIKAWTKDPQRYWANAPQEVSDLLVGWMGPFHEGREQLQRDEAMRSMGMAMQTLMLAAKAEGYDSCPMIGYDFDAVAPLINLPPDHAIGPLVVLGKKTKDSWPKPGQLPLSEVVIEDGFPA
ncbi:MAG: nitroreductase family protein [Planctomycetota bacterium]